MSFDWQKVTESKRAFRKRLAAAPIVEKLRMLDALRERALVIRHASRTRSVAQEEASQHGIRKQTKQ